VVFLLFLCAPFLSLRCLKNYAYIQRRYTLFSCSVETVARLCIGKRNKLQLLYRFMMVITETVLLGHRMWLDNRCVCFVRNVHCATLILFYFRYLCVYVWSESISEKYMIAIWDFYAFSHVWKIYGSSWGTLCFYVKILCITSVLAFLFFLFWFI
jgi:hypothetical protein